MTKPEQVTLASIFRLAADKHLWSGVGPYLDHHRRYSCDAVGAAIGLLDIPWHARGCWSKKAEIFLDQMGLDDIRTRMDLYADLEDENGVATEASQDARYIWLQLCAVVAEEQGL